MKLLKSLPCVKDKSGNLQCYALFHCDFCGKNVRKLRASGKQCGSCGCQRAKGKFNSHYSHGDCTGKISNLYMVWADMKARCKNTNHRAYSRYGGRCISVCQEWQQYSPFRSWAESNGYRLGLTIDRVENDGNYAPSNCRWVDNMTNCRNSTRAQINVMVARQIKILLKEYAPRTVSNHLGVSIHIVRDIKRGKTWKDVKYEDRL